MNFADRVLKDVKRVLIPIRDPIRAQGAQAYMKKIAPYLGICAPDRRAATKPVFAALPTPTSQELGLAAVLLYAQREREYAYVANDLLDHFIETAERNFLKNEVAGLITTKSWWDTVDGLGSAAVSPLSRKYPSRTLMKEWIKSPNIWLNRAAIGHQRGRRAETDTEFALWLCHQKATEREFFIVKAIGWALRDIAAFDKPAVRQFLADHPDLGRVAVREAERGLNR
jgi:3-methyladenine DNA glycosylase AlkD